MKNRKNIFKMSAAALLMALIFLFGTTPFGLIPLGFINITVLCIPVIIGTIVLGLKTGLLLGFCFGTASMLSMVGLTMTPPSALASALFSASPLYAIIMCYVPRLMVPMSAYSIYTLMCRKGSKATLAVSVSSAAASLTNTVLYLGLMLLFYALCGLDTRSILALIAGTGLIAGCMEALAAALISVPVIKALSKTPVGSHLGGKL